jgi:hypothetical protein
LDPSIYRPSRESRDQSYECSAEGGFALIRPSKQHSDACLCQLEIEAVEQTPGRQSRIFRVGETQIFNGKIGFLGDHKSEGPKIALVPDFFDQLVVDLCEKFEMPLLPSGQPAVEFLFFGIIAGIGPV